MAVTRDKRYLFAITMNTSEEYQIYTGVRDYCRRYNIPLENLVDILEDQKVLPMIRGKATEFVAAAFLRKTLNYREWQVQKLNLNAQGAMSDEDISITFARTGHRFKVESKSAVRGSFRLGTPRTKIKVPHFKVKCHRSRSYIAKASTTNDRYLADDFDLIVCNVSNAIFRGKALDVGLPLLEDNDALEWLKDFYNARNDEELVRSAYDDWRMCLPISIADEDGVIPRTPSVMMENDPNWFRPDELVANLRTLIR